MAHDPDIAERARRGLRWVGLASGLHGVLNVVALVLVLKYWVTPRDLGVATLALGLFPLLDVLADLGLSAALVQWDRVSEREAASVFFVAAAASTALLVLLVPAALLLGRVHANAVAGHLLVAYGAKLVLQNVSLVPEALMRRELRFGQLSVVRVVGNLACFAAKVGFAAAGFPVWSFVLAPIVRAAVNAAGVQLCRPWRPRCLPYVADAAAHLRYGLQTTGSQALFFAYTSADYQIVGLCFGPAALGLYRAARELVLEPVRFVSDVTVQVAFPTFARLRDDPARLGREFVAFTRRNVLVVWALAGAVLVAADDLLRVLMPQYLAAAPAARLLCVVGLMRALGFVMPPLLDGTGRPGLTLRYMALASILVPLACAASAAGARR